MSAQLLQAVYNPLHLNKSDLCSFNFFASLKMYFGKNFQFQFQNFQNRFSIGFIVKLHFQGQNNIC